MSCSRWTVVLRTNGPAVGTEVISSYDRSRASKTWRDFYSRWRRPGSVPMMKTAYGVPNITEQSGMAHNGQPREAAQRDELPEEVYQIHFENFLSGLDSVRSVRRKSSSWTNSARVDGILHLKICIITVAAMVCGCRSHSNSSSFSFDGNFLPSDFIILQDALISPGQINLNTDGEYRNAESRGRALYSIPVQFLEPNTNSVASFQTSFTFTIFAGDSFNKGHGFAFGLFPDVTALGDSGKFMGILVNTTSNNSITNSSNNFPPGFNHTFVVEFDTHQDIEFGDASDNHVGVNWNSMESLKATDLSALGLNLVTGNFTAWIEYSYRFRKLSVWMTTSVLNITDPPILEVTDLDLSERLLPSMYVGFAGGVGVGKTELHTITSWTFNSSFADVSSSGSKASGMDCWGHCKTKRMKMAFSVVACLVLAACLVTVSAFCFVRWRRRKAAHASISLKLNPTFQSPPVQECQNPGSTRSSLASKFLNSPRASLHSRPFSHRFSLTSIPFNSPRASLSSKYLDSPQASESSNPFSPRALLNPFTPRREPVMKRLSSLDPSSLRSKHSRNSSGAGSKRFTTTQELDAVSSLGPRRYTYRELKQATNSFKETLGRGGFGVVYKGYLPNQNEAGVPVAVKEVAADSGQGEREFLAEVNIIAGLRHRHLVQMQGWCHEKGKLLLIYDFMENGSLDKHLYETNQGDPVLSWDVRYKALCQVASALTYLHDEAEQRVIHRDVKASNVLLDSKFNSRLGDFGLARLSEHSQVTDTTVMAGTMGYLAPEIVHTGKATTKTDVFSFGTLILEVMCAKRPLDCNRPEREALLGDWVWGLLEAEQLLDAVDPRLVGQYDEAKMTRVLQVGLMCLHPDHSCRPPIRYALQMLLGDLALPTLPRKKPITSFASATVLIPIEDLLDLSMSTIAAAMECPTAVKNAEFQAPWMINISSPDLPFNDRSFLTSFRLPPGEPLPR